MVYNLAFQLWADKCISANVLHIGFPSWYVQLRRCVRVSQKRAAFTSKGTRPFFMELVLSKTKATGPFATSGTTYPPTQMTAQKTGDPRVQRSSLSQAYLHSYVPEADYSHGEGIMLIDVSLFLFLSW
jgi:hypothetical protein